MKATELRIGNWAMYSSKIQVNENKIRECVDHPDRFAPIPITEEWLVKFGFENDSYKWTKRMNTARGELLLLHSRRWGSNDHLAWVLEFTGESIKHVHELQNLYFALTGEELNQNKEDEKISSKTLG